MSPLQVVTEVVADDRDLLDRSPPDGAVAFVHGDDGLVGWGEAARLTPGPGPDRFAAAGRALAALADDAEVTDPVRRPGTGLVAVGAFTFDDRSNDSILVVPRVVLGRRDGVAWRTRIDPPDAPPPLDAPTPAPAAGPQRARYAGASVPDVHWLDAVARGLGRIGDGDLDKVVLARDHALWSEHPFDAWRLARRLHDRFPACFTFVVDGLVGASPELLVRRFGDRVESVTLAGTAPRGHDADEDARLGRSLLASDKDRREHAFAAEGVRRVLADLLDELDADDEPVLLRLDNVQHLATRFAGRGVDAPPSLRVAAALHPTPAVGGWPTAEALAAIRELEGLERGRYAAPVGWTAPDGDGEWAIALRCAQLRGARARLFAGAGVVAGSLPEDELEETRLKLRAMQSAFGG